MSASLQVIHFTDVFHQKKLSEKKKKSDTDLPQVFFMLHFHQTLILVIIEEFLLYYGFIFVINKEFLLDYGINSYFN